MGMELFACKTLPSCEKLSAAIMVIFMFSLLLMNYMFLFGRNCGLKIALQIRETNSEAETATSRLNCVFS